jgi:hypothetical protein
MKFLSDGIERKIINDNDDDSEDSDMDVEKHLYTKIRLIPTKRKYPPLQWLSLQNNSIEEKDAKTLCQILQNKNINIFFCDISMNGLDHDIINLMNKICKINQLKRYERIEIKMYNRIKELEENYQPKTIKMISLTKELEEKISDLEQNVLKNNIRTKFFNKKNKKEIKKYKKNKIKEEKSKAEH